MLESWKEQHRKAMYSPTIPLYSTNMKNGLVFTRRIAGILPRCINLCQLDKDSVDSNADHKPKAEKNTYLCVQSLGEFCCFKAVSTQNALKEPQSCSSLWCALGRPTPTYTQNSFFLPTSRSAFPHQWVSSIDV